MRVKSTRPTRRYKIKLDKSKLAGDYGPTRSVVCQIGVRYVYAYDLSNRRPLYGCQIGVRYVVVKSTRRKKKDF